MSKTKIYKIEGMQCTGCANSIQENIKEIKGVTEVTVDFNAGSLSVTGNPEDGAVENVVESLGYGISK